MPTQEMMMPESEPERRRERNPLDPFGDLLGAEKIEKPSAAVTEKIGSGSFGPIKPPPTPLRRTGGEREGEPETLQEFMRRRTKTFDRYSWEFTSLVKQVCPQRELVGDFANVLWSLLISTGAVGDALLSLDEQLSKAALRRANYFIVPYESGGSIRQTLLVFLPEHLPSDITVPLGGGSFRGSNVIEQMLREQSRKLRPQRGGVLVRDSLQTMLLLESLHKFGDGLDQAIVDLMESVGLSVVVTRTPPIKPQVGLPLAAIGLASVRGQPPESSIGVIARNHKYFEGVTVSYHGLETTTSRGYVGQLVEVNGLPGEVVSCDCLTDSAFVKLDGGISGIEQKNFRGVRSGSTPGFNEPAKFNGLSSGPKDTRTDAAPPISVVNMPGLQRWILTKPDTMEGDSGCALLDANNDVMGFCLGMTGKSPIAPVSVWIWAETVFGEQQLT